MILQALYRLAETERLVPDPDFEVKQIRWLITVGDGGRFLGIQDTNWTPPAEGRKKPKAVAKSFSVPRCGGRTSADKAFFLHDKCEYVFGLDPDPEGDATAPEKLANRAMLFRKLAAACASETRDAGAAAVRDFLVANTGASAPVQPREGTGPGDLFGFIYAPDVDMLVTEREAVRAWWKARRAGPGPGEAQLTCLVSGKRFAETDLFPKTKRVPGVQGDISLVSYNKGAFESFGLKGNDNAPVCREAAEAAATALNRLLHPAYPKPSDPSQTLPPRSFRLAEDTCVCFWAAGRDGGFSDALTGLFDGDVRAVPEMYHSLWRGGAAPKADMAPFYGLVLTGTQGRAIVREWIETTLPLAQENLSRHFAALAIVRNAPWKKDEPPPPAVPMRTLLESLAPHGKGDQIPSALAAQFVRAALAGGPYPFAILTRAIERHRAEIGATEWADLQRRDARASLIKAVLNRLPQNQPDPNRKEVTRSMDPENKNPGYVLGCLMAVLERLQQEALDDVNASVVDKFFSGASAAPKATFDRLVRNARHHARKAERGEKGGMAFRLERLLDELMLRINVRTDRGQPVGFPLTLPIEQQGLFVIGYHHMRHWLWMSREERLAWEQEQPSAPRAFLWSKKSDGPANLDSNPT